MVDAPVRKNLHAEPEDRGRHGARGGQRDQRSQASFHKGDYMCRCSAGSTAFAESRSLKGTMPASTAPERASCEAPSRSEAATSTRWPCASASLKRATRSTRSEERRVGKECRSRW